MKLDIHLCVKQETSVSFTVDCNKLFFEVVNKIKIMEYVLQENTFISVSLLQNVMFNPMCYLPFLRFQSENCLKVNPTPHIFQCRSVLYLVML